MCDYEKKNKNEHEMCFKYKVFDSTAKGWGFITSSLFGFVFLKTPFGWRLNCSTQIAKNEKVKFSKWKDRSQMGYLWIMNFSSGYLDRIRKTLSEVKHASKKKSPNFIIPKRLTIGISKWKQVTDKIFIGRKCLLTEGYASSLSQ